MLFFARANSNIGAGHLVRTLGVVRQGEALNYPVKLVVRGPSDIVDFFVESSDPLQVVSTSQEVHQAIRNVQSSVVCFDSPCLDERTVTIARNAGADLIASLDGETSATGLDLVFDSEPGSPRDVGKAKVLTGVEYRVIPERIKNYRPDTPWESELIQNILVSFGSSDPGQLSEKLLRQIFDDTLQDLPRASLTIVCGPGMSEDRVETIDKLSHQYAKCINISILDTVNDMARLIIESDFVLTLGGNTAFESMCLGRPVGVVPWNGLKSHTQNLIQQNLAIKIPEENMLKEIFSINNKKLQETSKNGWQNIDALGAQRILNQINDF